MKPHPFLLGLKKSRINLAAGKRTALKPSFTLLEVLISLVVLTVGITMIFQFFFNFASALNHLNQRVKAHFLLGQKKWQAVSQFSEKGAPVQYLDEAKLGNTYFLTKIFFKNVFDSDSLWQMTAELTWQERAALKRLWEKEYLIR